MTPAEKKMILFLIYDGGADCCQKCIHTEKPTCCCYVSPKDYSGDIDDDYCIKGMVKYFKKELNDKK